MNDQQFHQLLDRFGLSQAGYKKVRKGVKKRISRHMQQLRCRNIIDYINTLDKDDEAKKECELLLTVSISRFFRDRQLWQVLEKDILSGLIKTEKKEIKFKSSKSKMDYFAVPINKFIRIERNESLNKLFLYKYHIFYRHP